MKIERIEHIAPGVIGVTFGDGFYHCCKALHIGRNDKPESDEREMLRMQFRMFARDAAMEIARMRLKEDELLEDATKRRPDLFRV